MLTLRKATLADAKALFRWRNDPLTRAMSESGEEVGYEGHLNWLAGKLSDPHCRFYIAELDGAPAGTIRFEGLDEAAVSWTVAPGFRGRGVCKAMARLGLAREGRVVAYVRADNSVCQHVLADVGFRLTEGSDMQTWIREEPARHA